MPEGLALPVPPQGPALAVGAADALGHAVLLSEAVAEGLLVAARGGEGAAVPEAMPVRDKVGLTLALTVAVAAGEALGVPLTLRSAVGEWEEEAVARAPLAVAVAVGCIGEPVEEEEEEGLGEALWPVLGPAEEEEVGEGVPEPRPAVGVVLAVGECSAVTLPVLLPLWQAVPWEDREAVAVGEPVAQLLALAEGLREGEEDREGLVVAEPVALMERVPASAPVRVTVKVKVTLPDCEAVPVAVLEQEGEREAHCTVRVALPWVRVEAGVRVRVRPGLGEGVGERVGGRVPLALGTGLGEALSVVVALAEGQPLGELVKDWQPVRRKREASNSTRICRCTWRWAPKLVLLGA